MSWKRCCASTAKICAGSSTSCQKNAATSIIYQNAWRLYAHTEKTPHFQSAKIWPKIHHQRLHRSTNMKDGEFHNKMHDNMKSKRSLQCIKSIWAEPVSSAFVNTAHVQEQNFLADTFSFLFMKTETSSVYANKSSRSAPIWRGSSVLVKIWKWVGRWTSW